MLLDPFYDVILKLSVPFLTEIGNLFISRAEPKGLLPGILSNCNPLDISFARLLPLLC